MREKLLLIVLLVVFVSSVSGQGDSDMVLQRSADLEKSRGSGSLIGNYGKPRIALPVLPKELREKLQVTKDEKAEIRNSLKFPKAKIFKLWNNLCSDSKVVDVNNDRDCLKTSQYTMGSSYSFELKNYHSLYASVSLVGRDFSVHNKYGSAQIMTDLGTVNLEEINEKSVEIIKISLFTMFDKNGYPAWRDEPESLDFNGLKLSHKLVAQPSHTYVLRSVFLDNTQLVRAYKEALIAFRLVKIENNIATILWKPISSKWV